MKIVTAELMEIPKKKQIIKCAIILQNIACRFDLSEKYLFAIKRC